MKLPVRVEKYTTDGWWPRYVIVDADGNELDEQQLAAAAQALNRQAAADKLAEAVDTFFTEMGDMLQGDAQVAAANKLDAALSDYRSEAKG
jgi:hypothetical protein